MKRLRSSFYYIILIISVLCSHGWLVINQSVNWDDWLVKSFLDDGNWSELNSMTSEMGLPILGYFFWSIKLLGFVENFKWISLALILLSSLVVYEIGHRTCWLKRWEALLLSFIFAVYPAYQTTILLSTLQYQFFYLIFLVATLCYLISSTVIVNKMAQTFLYLFSLSMFFISFNLNSLLVIYYVFFICLFLNEKRVRGFSYQEKLHFAFRYRLHFLLMPIFYWVIKQIFFPRHGLYLTYNQFKFVGIFQRLADGFDNLALYPIMKSFNYMVDFPIEFVVCFFVILIVSTLYKNRIVKPSTSSLMSKKGLKISLWVGLLFLLSGIFPYAVTGHVPSRSGWNSRHAILVGLPMAIIIISLLKLVLISTADKFSLQIKQNHLISIRSMLGFSVILFGFCTIIVGFVISTGKFYSIHQMRALKDQSIITKLEAQKSYKKYSVFWVNDKFQIGGDPPYYNYYEWSSIFRKAWGGQSYVGIPLYYNRQPQPLDLPPKVLQSARYNLDKFNPNGLQACLLIERNMLNMSDYELVLKYMAYSINLLFSHTEYSKDVETFFDNVAMVDVKELSQSEPFEGCSIAHGLKS